MKSWLSWCKTALFCTIRPYRTTETIVCELRRGLTYRANFPIVVTSSSSSTVLPFRLTIQLISIYATVPNDVAFKWKNLKVKFIKLRKLDCQEALSGSSSELASTKWNLYEHMCFLNEHVSDRQWVIFCVTLFVFHVLHTFIAVIYLTFKTFKILHRRRLWKADWAGTKAPCFVRPIRRGIQKWYCTSSGMDEHIGPIFRLR